MTFPKTLVQWRPCYRIIPSRFPPIDLFERVAAPSDWALLQEIEGQTSSRLREEAGAIHLVREEDRRYGPGWTPVMAAFCHFAAAGTRFTDGTFGAYYCAFSEATAIAETRYHTERFMRESHEAPSLLPRRVYHADLEAELIDLRSTGEGKGEGAPLLDPDDWSAGRILGRRAWLAQEDGIVYPSVRDPQGECAAVLRPPVLSPARQGRHLGYEWDGQRIRHVVEISRID